MKKLFSKKLEQIQTIYWRDVIGLPTIERPPFLSCVLTGDLNSFVGLPLLADLLVREAVKLVFGLCLSFVRVLLIDLEVAAFSFSSFS